MDLLYRTFETACSDMMEGGTSVIPADFDLQEAAALPRAQATLGSINSGFTDALLNYLADNPLPQQHPDLFAMGSDGGEVPAAERMIEAMQQRQEVVFVMQAESAATAVVGHADEVYAREDAQFMFHEARVKAETLNAIHPQIAQDLAVITGKEDDFLARDFQALHEALVASPTSTESYRNFAEAMADQLEGHNEFLAAAYRNGNPDMGHACSVSLVTESDQFLSAEEALRLGIVDAVLLDDGDFMLVKEGDPRAAAFREAEPEEYAVLNSATPVSEATDPDAQQGQDYEL